MKTFKCNCGKISGVDCSIAAPANEMTVIEWMPEHIRSSHEAAGNRGVHPRNGSMRLGVHRACAAGLIESDPEWTRIVDGADVADYADPLTPASEVRAAIERSISRNETVIIETAFPLAVIDEIAAISDDMDQAGVDAGVDVWGDLDGEDFRLLVVTR